MINRLPINSNNDDKHYEAQVTRQTRNDKKHDTDKSYDSFSIGSTVVVQWVDSGLRTHGTLVGRGDHNCNNRSYMIRISKIGHSHQKHQPNQVNTYNSQTTPQEPDKQKTTYPLNE